MKRIDPNKVAEFFATHRDIEPLSKAFVEYDDHDEDFDSLKACCGLTSLIVDSKDRPFTLADLYGKGIPEVAPMIADELGVSDGYAAGFAMGWDGCDLSYADGDNEARHGYLDGMVAYRLTTEALSCHE